MKVAIEQLNLFRVPRLSQFSHSGYFLQQFLLFLYPNAPVNFPSIIFRAGFIIFNVKYMDYVITKKLTADAGETENRACFRP